MARPPDEHRRAALLDALIDTVARDGIGGRSLRDLADAAGTSHRMLIHYFGSRDDLLVAIVQEVERRQTAMLDDIPSDSVGAMEAMWGDVRRPELWPFERLFFECYARAAQGEEPFTRMLPGAIDDWLRDVAAHADGPVDPGLLRLGLAVSRGLLLDLVATGDVAGVDAAAAAFVALLRLQDEVSPAPPSAPGSRASQPVRSAG
jgi:AcrR family transcriptional regulator